MQSSESGRKLNQAVGKAVTSTGKAVGGAISQAKGAFSTWWSSVTTTTGLPAATTPDAISTESETNFGAEEKTVSLPHSNT